jgi:hypothetical protein
MASSGSVAPSIVRADLAGLPLQLISSAPIGATSSVRNRRKRWFPDCRRTNFRIRPFVEKAMDRLLKKLRALTVRAGEQILVASVLAFHLIAVAILTIPDSLSVTSLGDLVWDQFSTPGPHAPAGDVTFKLLKIWADHIIDVEIPRIRSISAVAAQIFGLCRVYPRRPPIQTRGKPLRSIGLNPRFIPP